MAAATGAAAPFVATPDVEIQRGIAYGFVPQELQGDWHATIRFSQCCEIISRMVSVYAPQGLAAWKDAAKLALSSEEWMQRDDGVLALYYGAIAAGLDGYDQETGYDLGGVETFWDGAQWDYPLFPQWQQEWTSSSTPHYTESDFFKGAAFFAVRRLSYANGYPLFDIEGGALRFGDPLTRGDLVRAVVRLYESDEAVAANAGLERGASYHAMVAKIESMKSRILQSETSIVPVDSKEGYIQGENYYGKAYYVSNEGSDKNNGQSPEKAWATLKKVNTAKLQAGDAVFFRRGDAFRGIGLQCQSGVTYSAYGEGGKPIITLSPEEGAVEEKWTLHWEGSQGEKIWRFYRDLDDCGGIIFNEGGAWADKIAPRWQDGRFCSEDGEPFHVSSGLTKDLDFFSEADSKLPSQNGQIPLYELKPKQVPYGPLYLRCDRGNPGIVFESVELLLDTDIQSKLGTSMVNIPNRGAGSVVDNLSLRYGGSSGIADCRGGIVQNCEIAYIGGKIMQYQTDGKELHESVVTAGDGMALLNDDGGYGLRIIRHNYFHNCYQNGITLEASIPGLIANIEISGNLFENNHEGLQLTHFWPNAEEYLFRNITIQDNIIARSGYGWGSSQSTQGPQRPCSLGFGDSENPSENLVIRNNEFFLSKGIHLYGAMPKAHAPTFTDNTFYCWFYESTFALWQSGDFTFYRVGDSERFLEAFFGNSSNRVVSIFDSLLHQAQ